MLDVLGGLFQPLALLFAAIAAFGAARLLTGDFAPGGETVAAFFAAWLGKPLLFAAIIYFSADREAAAGTVNALGMLAGVGSNLAFALIGCFAWMSYRDARGGGT
jgi:hypothetical protein